MLRLIVPDPKPRTSILLVCKECVDGLVFYVLLSDSDLLVEVDGVRPKGDEECAPVYAGYQ